jgi:hypothetical protein
MVVILSAKGRAAEVLHVEFHAGGAILFRLARGTLGTPDETCGFNQLSCQCGCSVYVHIDGPNVRLWGTVTHRRC